MNALSPLPGQTMQGGGGLHTRRCERHEAREAAAKCPACGGFFCRECVVDHAGLLLCARCLAQRVATAGVVGKNWARLRRSVFLTAAILAIWAAFFSLGALLLKVPSKVHEGTVWKSEP